MEDYYTHRNSAHRFEIKQIDDSGDIQLIDADGMVGESFTQIMRVYPHGFNSRSIQGSHMVGLGLGGRRDLLVALGGEHHEKRVKDLEEGETVLYDSEGNVVFMKLGKGISCNAKKGPVEIISQKDAVTVTSEEKSVDIKSKTDTTVQADGEMKMASKGTAAFGSSDGITYIGGDGTDGTYAFVVTEAGISTKVKAKM